MQSSLINHEDLTDLLLSSSKVMMVNQTQSSITYSIKRNGKELILINTPNENYLIQ
jgi:hypothetical protein